MLSQFPLTFSQTQKEMPFCIALDCLPILNFDWSSLLISIAKTAPQKMEPCIVL